MVGATYLSHLLRLETVIHVFGITMLRMGMESSSLRICLATLKASVSVELSDQSCKLVEALSNGRGSLRRW